MQFDLFYVYMVDEYSICLFKYIYLFSDVNNYDCYFICCEIYFKIQKKELFIFVVIFYDIGKGCGGDYLEIGVDEVFDFCIEYGLFKLEVKLVVWLVKNYFLMLVIVQCCDIYDLDVIIEFVKKVCDEECFEYLVCLIVVDICVINFEFWNSWKWILLVEFFYLIQCVLWCGLENFVDVCECICYNQ